MAKKKYKIKCIKTLTCNFVGELYTMSKGNRNRTLYQNPTCELNLLTRLAEWINLPNLQLVL